MEWAFFLFFFLCPKKGAQGTQVPAAFAPSRIINANSLGSFKNRLDSFMDEDVRWNYSKLGRVTGAASSII